VNLVAWHGCPSFGWCSRGENLSRQYSGIHTAATNSLHNNNKKVALNVLDTLYKLKTST
jgi:hypothetical protein